MNRLNIKIGIALAVLSLVMAACTDPADEALDDDLTIEMPANDEAPADDDALGDDQGTTDGAVAGGDQGDGDATSVWPLPTANAQVLFAWTQTDDELQLSENSDFTMTDIDADGVLTYYREYFPSIGLEINEFAAGTSTVMNLTKPADPSWSGVLQTADNSDGTATVHQEFTDYKEPGETTTGETVSGSSSPDEGESGD